MISTISLVTVATNIDAERYLPMRTLFTVLAFLIILWAVLPAVRRSLLLTRKKARSHGEQDAL